MATLAANTYKFRLCFSTWACPEWTAAAIVDGIDAYGFEGVELVLGKGHLHGVDTDSGPEYLQDVRKQFDEGNVAVACVSTSYQLFSPEAKAREETIDELKQCLRVCEQLGTPYIRVYGGSVPPGCEEAGVVDYTADALAEVAEFAEEEKLRARILLQTNGAFSHSKYLSEVMTQVASSRVGVLWDLANPIQKLEKVEDTYDTICEYVKHVHVHDFIYNDDRTKVSSCSLGEGFVPLDRVVDLLKASAYRGYLSLDLVNQEIDPDELLPECAEYLKKVISGEGSDE